MLIYQNIGKLKKKALLAYGNEIKNQKTSRDLNSLKSFYEYKLNMLVFNITHCKEH